MEMITLTAILAAEGCTLGNVFSGVLGGLLTNYADRELSGLNQVLESYLNRGNQPLNHDLEKALCRCFLKALHTIAWECHRDIRNGAYRGQPTYIQGKDEEGRWLAGQINSLKKALQQVEKAQPEGIFLNSLHELQVLMQPSPPPQYENHLKEKLLDHSAIKNSPVASYREQAEASLFERICAFFAQEIKETPEVRDLFQTRLLVEINTTLQENLALTQEGVGNTSSITSSTSQSLTAEDSAQILQYIAKQEVPQLVEDLGEEEAETEFLQTAIPTNPFDYGSPVNPERFYGRKGAIADIISRVGAISAQCINIVGQRRNGKTSLLRYIQERPEEIFPPQQRPLLISLDLQKNKFHTPTGILEGIRREIFKHTGREPWLRTENEDPFAVEDGLEAVVEQGYRLIIILDEFERIGYRLDEFQDWGEDWRAKVSASLFALVIASKRPVSEVYQQLNLTSPFSNVFSTTVIGALEEEAWRQLVIDGFQREVSETQLAWIGDLAGGLPYYTKLAAAMLWQHDNLEVAKREFIFQATPRFRELWQDLQPLEKQAVRYRAGVKGIAAPNWAVRDILQRQGLFGQDMMLFSSAFAEFIREAK